MGKAEGDHETPSVDCAGTQLLVLTFYCAELAADVNDTGCSETLPASSKGEQMGESERMLQFFKADHLPVGLREVSQPFCNLAFEMCAVLNAGPERTVMLRKLLEAKDCAVRSKLEQSSAAQKS